MAVICDFNLAILNQNQIGAKILNFSNLDEVFEVLFSQYKKLYLLTSHNNAKYTK